MTGTRTGLSDVDTEEPMGNIQKRTGLEYDMLSLAKTITIKTVFNFNYSQTLIINEEPWTKTKKEIIL